MANTFELIASSTVGSGGAASIDFTSIPSTYTDLILVVNAKVSSAGQVLELQYNSDTGTNYSATELFGNGTSAASARRSSVSSYQTSWDIVNFPNVDFGNAIVHLMNYSNTTTYKTFLSRTNSPSATYGGVVTNVGLWRSTSAINSIKIFVSSTFVTGSTFTLYGITAA